MRRLLIVVLALLVTVPVVASGPVRAGYRFGSAGLDDCPEPPSGLIGQRWRELGGKYGALGCPTGPERDAPGRTGKLQSFANGEMAWSPEQGTDLVVAGYQRGRSLVFNWGPTAPFHYDFFLVRWDLNGTNAGQEESHFAADHGYFYTNPESGGRYTVMVEGCDGGGIGGATCRQGWTIPVTVQIQGSTHDGVSEPVDCPIASDGAIGYKWRSLGADRGPLGCPTGPEREVPGRQGRVQTFAHGEVAFSPEQGTDLTVAAYLLWNRVTVDWGPTDPYRYNFYQVRWDRLGSGGGNLGQAEVHGFNNDPFTAGRWSTVLHGFATYSFVVQGCDSGTFGSRCRQGWTVPVTVQLGEYTGSANRCAIAAGGLIGERWHELGAWDGPLGCPAGPERDAAGGTGRIQTFDNGEVAWSPRQGASMVVAAYRQGGAALSAGDKGAPVNRPQGGTMVVDWGPTGPYHYDFFLVRWTDASGHVHQEQAGGGDRGTFYPGGGPDARISFQVEGCDGRLLASSRCRQGWTVPVAAPSRALGDVPIGDISADSPGTPDDKLAQRVRRATDHLACTRLVTLDGGAPTEDLGAVLAARLDRVRTYGLADRCPGELPNVLVVNEALRWIQRGELGTSFEECGIKGDYDTFLKGLLAAAYRYRDLLNADVRKRIAVELLGVNGPHDERVETKTFCRLEEGPESENHLLLIESARYLGNQLVFPITQDALWENVDNGEEEWLLNFLHTIAQHDFLEYNSRIYQRYSINALLNLYDFAQSPRMRLAAQHVLDYTTTKFAVSSNSLRRAGPYRRLKSNSDLENQSYFTGNSDPQTAFFLAYTGLSEYTGRVIPNYWVIEASIAGLSTYRPPAAALALATATDTYAEHRFFSGPRPRLREAEEADPSVEIYSRSPSFLLTAGGVFLNSGYLSDQFRGYRDNGVAQATTLMPTRANLDRNDLIRFDGLRRPGVPADRDVINTCVAGGFACGVQLALPARYDGCRTTSGASWVFYDLTSPACGQLGFFVAVHRNAVPDRADPRGFIHYGDIGFLHAAEASGTFQAFIDQILAANPNLPDRLTVDGTYEFRTATGQHSYRFRIQPDQDRYANRVLAVDGQDQPAITDWPLVSGNYLRAPRDHDGYLEIEQPGCTGKLILDFTNPAWPTRTDTTTC